MDCPKCGHDGLPEKARFCSGCGAAIPEAPTRPAARIEVTQEVGSVEGGRVVGLDVGQVVGDVTIGNYTLRIGSVHGGVVNVASPHQQRLPQPRPLPVFLLPRRSPGLLLGRKAETAAATAALRSASPVGFHGPAGVGKTKLLRHLAHDQLTSEFPDGVVCFSAIRHKPVEDLLLDLFDAFYEREATYKPTPVQVRHALQGKRALIVLDDVGLERDDVAALMDAAPSCAFLLASTECCLWGEDGRAVALRGLPPDDALALVERELGRPLTEEERPAAQALCAASEGNPLRLLQLAALVREDGRALADLATLLRAGPPAEALREQALAACSEQERRILEVLAVPMGASLGERHVSALTGIAEVAPELDSLRRRKLVQSHGSRCSLTGSPDDAPREEWDPSPWNARALEHFADWAEHQRQAPERVAEEADAILGILRRALQEGRWAGALRLGRAAEGALALGGRWGAWAQVLGWELRAARALGDRAAEAWSLHQSGTRALCVEDSSTAHADLTEALELRESLGDREGVAVTRHNLELVGFGGPDGDHEPEGDGSGGGGDGGGGGWWRPRLWLGALGLVCALGLLGAATLDTEATDSRVLEEPLQPLSEDSGAEEADSRVLPDLPQWLFEGGREGVRGILPGPLKWWLFEDGREGDGGFLPKPVRKILEDEPKESKPEEPKKPPNPVQPASVPPPPPSNPVPPPPPPPAPNPPPVVPPRPPDCTGDTSYAQAGGVVAKTDSDCEPEPPPDCPDGTIEAKAGGAVAKTDSDCEPAPVPEPEPNCTGDTSHAKAGGAEAKVDDCPDGIIEAEAGGVVAKTDWEPAPAPKPAPAPEPAPPPEPKPAPPPEPKPAPPPESATALDAPATEPATEPDCSC
jgi:hypothetical protein